MVCEKCEKKLGTVITPDTWKDGARNTTGLILMERTSLQYVGFVRVLSISQGLTIVKDVPIKKLPEVEDSLRLDVRHSLCVSSCSAVVEAQGREAPCAHPGDEKKVLLATESEQKLNAQQTIHLTHCQILSSVTSSEDRLPSFHMLSEYEGSCIPWLPLDMQIAVEAGTPLCLTTSLERHKQAWRDKDLSKMEGFTKGIEGEQEE
ncbi:hypothetical protein WISP_19528 [Willisornis vidua]|uniref:Cysteine-rich PDZ-binding protein n=1 Tax=Willisornis vidua TaxID=1566151 RepID=A0ABQ9DT92_9PASS|nr:hypothetical protein WISP_19528 [Willisornis vidua]